MKANELMIGDWVKLINPKGEWLDSRKLNADLFCIFLRDGENGFLQFAPIPLTAEILEKNGWKCKTNEISTDVRGEIAKDVWFMMQLLDGYDHWNIRLSKSTARKTFELFIQSKYVHELQHTLRLCGLNELADNFKI